MSALDIGRIVVLAIQIGCYAFAFIAFPLILRRNSRKLRQELAERDAARAREREMARKESRTA